ncbi:protein of unknown function [Cupriavidus taiwanensis]|uniref:Uncharacterized protein n=1 Tax=Cupriavidus taiwanensis TaxID=164546 RepID=A0A375IAE1_9BURK|nr:protein of unknown function [Cupriavidus taiwanensis]
MNQPRYLRAFLPTELEINYIFFDLGFWLLVG